MCSKPAIDADTLNVKKSGSILEPLFCALGVVNSDLSRPQGARNDFHYELCEFFSHLLRVRNKAMALW